MLSSPRATLPSATLPPATRPERRAQRPGALVRRVHMVDVPTTNGLHDLGHAVRLPWRHEQVDVMGHQDVRMHRRRVPRRGLVERRQGEAILVLVQEDGLPIMPALDDMLRDPWQSRAGRSGHPTPPNGGHDVH